MKRPEKMKTQLQGPYEVVKSDKSLYTIENLVDKKHLTVHITNLRPYYFDPAVMDPAIIAMHDNQEFVIEVIENFVPQWNSLSNGKDSIIRIKIHGNHGVVSETQKTS
jgi:hypothetical protein